MNIIKGYTWMEYHRLGAFRTRLAALHAQAEGEEKEALRRIIHTIGEEIKVYDPRRDRRGTGTNLAGARNE